MEERLVGSLLTEFKRKLRRIQNQTGPAADRSTIDMLIRGIVNPHINSLLCRVRHTNSLVIADRRFPFWPQIETVDISLVDTIPTVLQVLHAIRPNFSIGEVVMAEEFQRENIEVTRQEFEAAMSGLKVTWEPHVKFKQRVPQAIGLIRTADTIEYANMILISA